MDHKFDKIKNALTPDAPLHTDIDALWTDIERELNKDKKQRRPVFFILLLLGLGLSAAGIFIFIQKNAKVNHHQQTVRTQHDAKHQKDSILSTRTNQKQAASIISPKTDTMTENESKIAVNKNADVQLDFPKPQLQGSPSKRTYPSNELQKNDIKNQTYNVDFNNTSIQMENDPSIIENHTQPASFTASVPFELLAVDNASDRFMKSEEQKSSIRYFVDPIATLKTNNIKSAFEGKVQLLTSLLPYSVHQSAPKKSWELQFSSGFSTWEKYNQTYAPTLQTISQRRNTISTPKESLTAMVMIKKEILPRWYLGLGVQYNQLTEVIQAKDIKVTKKEITSDSAFYYVGANSVEYFKGNIIQTNRKGYLIYSPNYIKRWNIPLELSYQYTIGRVHLVPSVSLLYNVSQRYEGIHLGLDGEFIYKDQTALGKIYRTSGLMSWAWAIDAEWSLSKIFALNIGLVNQNDLNSVLRDDILMSEKYRQLGLSLGMKVKI